VYHIVTWQLPGYCLRSTNQHMSFIWLPWLVDCSRTWNINWISWWVLVSKCVYVCPCPHCEGIYLWYAHKKMDYWVNSIAGNCHNLYDFNYCFFSPTLTLNYPQHQLYPNIGCWVTTSGPFRNHIQLWTSL